MKEVARQESSAVRILNIPWLPSKSRTLGWNSNGSGVDGTRSDSL